MEETGYSPQGRKELDTTERLQFPLVFIYSIYFKLFIVIISLFFIEVELIFGFPWWCNGKEST